VRSSGGGAGACLAAAEKFIFDSATVVSRWTRKSLPCRRRRRRRDVAVCGVGKRPLY